MLRTEIGKALGRFERRLWPQAPAILIYHRVCDPAADVWGIATDPARFAEQVEALQTVREIVSLDAVLAARGPPARGRRPLAAITFDDGYADVFLTARPILERLGAPATVFVVSGLVDAGREFWWDELAFIFLGPHALPPTLELARRGRSPARLPTADAGGRRAACHRLRRTLRNLAPERIETRLEALRSWAALERPARAAHRVMSADEIARLAGGPLAVGAHTVRHPVLPSLDGGRQFDEIEASRRACETLAGAPVRHFAYPFGDFDGRSLRAARRAGLASACTTIPSIVRPLADPFRLPRIDPGAASGVTLAAALA